MKDQAKPAPTVDNTQQITIQLPNRIIERVEKYDKENGNTITGVVIEALDSFLRGPDVY
ncbi:hypothetical protein [Desulfosarcina sp.]|uniref:hypothetical protein n=1 Tax=Desulfosarcina sp. TaxID=2027861 RepID=UPI00356A12A9